MFTPIINIVMRKFLLIACALWAVDCAAQISISGVVTDQKTGDALPFVNIAISGTTLGTISNTEGAFSLVVPDGMSGRDLSFSSVGYSPVSHRIGAGVRNQDFTVSLAPVDLAINEVLVTDKSEAGRRIMRDVIRRLESNYVDRDFAYSGQYKCVVSDGRQSMESSYQYNAYDAEGYVAGGDAFAALNYKMARPVRNFKVDDFDKGLNYFHIASGMDIVRHRLGVLNPNTLMDFDFRIKSEDAQTYVIEFSCNKPALQNTGTASASSYRGEITVLKSNNVVVSASYAMELDSHNDISLSVKPHEKNAGPRATVQCSLTYDKFYGKYCVSQIDVSTQLSDGKTIVDNLRVTSVNYKVPGKIQGKVFYMR